MSMCADADDRMSVALGVKLDEIGELKESWSTADADTDPVGRIYLKSK